MLHGIGQTRPCTALLGPLLCSVVALTACSPDPEEARARAELTQRREALVRCLVLEASMTVIRSGRPLPDFTASEAVCAPFEAPYAQSLYWTANVTIPAHRTATARSGLAQARQAVRDRFIALQGPAS